MTLRYKILVMALLAFAPLWVLANQKHSGMNQSNDLAAQIQTQLSGVAPDTVVVVVDHATKTAYVYGSTSNTNNVDQVTQALLRIPGIRVVGNRSGSAIGMSSNSRSTTRTSVTPSNTTGTKLDMDHAADPESMNSAAGTPGTPDADSDMRTNSNVTNSDMGKTGTNSTDQKEATEAGSAGTTMTNHTGSATNGTVVSDASLTQSVKDALKSEGMVGQNHIRVEARNGMVTLTGTALSEAMADRIVELTRQVPGVKDVSVNIQLNDEQRPYNVKPSPNVDKEGRPIDDDQPDR